MAKTPTDYELIFLGWRENPQTNEKERTFHKKHVKSKDLDFTQPYYEEFNGNRYRFMPNRAFRLKGWIPFKRWDRAHPFKSLRELWRRKRIALLIFPEPDAIMPKKAPVPLEEVSDV